MIEMTSPLDIQTLILAEGIVGFKRKEKPKKEKVKKSNKETKVKKEKKEKISKEVIEKHAVKEKEKKKKKKEKTPAQKRAEAKRKAQKAAIEKERMRREAEMSLIQLIGDKEFLKNKLNELNPSKKKDARAIVEINMELKNIEYQIKEIEAASGIHMDELQKGSKWQRFTSKIKHKGKNIIKKIKKFSKKNSGTICKVATILIPVAISAAIKLFAR